MTLVFTQVTMAITAHPLCLTFPVTKTLPTGMCVFVFPHVKSFIMRQASCKFVDIYLSAYLYAYPSKWKILTDMDAIAHPCQCEIEMHAV